METKEKENTLYQNLWDMTKPILNEYIFFIFGFLTYNITI